MLVESLAACLFGVSTAHAATAEELALSMEVPAADLTSAAVVGDASAYDVLTELGIVLPTTGADNPYLFTGRIGVSPQIGTDFPPLGSSAGDETQLELSLMAPKWANSFTFDFYFFSAEYPEFVGSVYNDSFEANVASSAWTGNAAIDSVGNAVNINSVLFTVTNPSDLTGTGFEANRGGGTGWLSIVVPVTPSENVDFTMRVYDRSDGIYDSGVLLDGFAWSESVILDPIIVQKIDVIYLSPKRGSIEGGDIVQVVGDKFNETCVASLDGTEALSTTYLDDEHLEISTPPHAEGLVDVTVACIGTDDMLFGGYTYYDVDAGELPPLIEAVEPYIVSTAGGELIDVLGSDFNDGAVVSVDGVAVDTVYVDNWTLRATAQAHSPGPVNVSVENPSGLADLRVGALVYEEPDEGPAPPEDTGDLTETGADDKPAGSGSTGCSTSAAGGVGISFVGLAGLALLLRRRRA
jgi:uncharacterized protein (TIGR03382 family)